MSDCKYELEMPYIYIWQMRMPRLLQFHKFIIPSNTACSDVYPFQADSRNLAFNVLFRLQYIV